MSGWISSKLKVAETLLQQIDQQAAESLRKTNDSSSRSTDNNDDVSTHPTHTTTTTTTASIPKKPNDILPHHLNKNNNKKNTKHSPSPPHKTDVVGANPKLESEANVNAKSSLRLSDGDWTELLSAPSKGVGRGSGLLKDGKRPLLRSGSNLLGLDRKRGQTGGGNKSVGRRSDVVLAEKANAERLDDGDQRVVVQDVAESLSGETIGKDGSGGTELTVSEMEGKNEQIVLDSGVLPGSGVVVASLSNKAESLSGSDGETDSDSRSSDSESEREREERRKRREQLLAEKAAAKAIEAIKDRENLVARLEGEKQSLEKIIDERAKQQAHEASQLQTTMMETMEAVDLEKQKHNNTRMEVLMKLAKLETTNAELARSLAAVQWNLELEVKRVAELHRQIQLKEASHEELTSKRERRLSGNKLNASRGVEFEHEILEAELAFVTDKVGQLQEKAKTLETTIQVTRKEIENPSEVEVELKRRLSQLTDHLIQKQAQVEALSSEKAMLMFRIEAVSRSLDESKSCLKTSDIESGGRWEVKSVDKGQIGSLIRQLDSIFSIFWTFLRRNPMGKLWSVIYLVCLHFWVLYIFRSHTAVSNEGSGDVISLENI